MLACSLTMKCSKLYVILIYLNIVLVRGNIHQKCCGVGEQIVEKEFRFICEKLINRRLQDTFEDREFLKRNVTGTCLEIFSETNITLFGVDEITRSIEKQKEYEGFFFPKCCPLKSHYNKTTHSCTEEVGNFFNILKVDSFVQVGLPECEIISDQIFESMEAVQLIGKELLLKEDNTTLEDGYCLDSTLDGKLVVRICEADTSICSQIRCISKCCPDGQSFINGSFCRDTFTHGVDLHFTKAILEPDDPFIIIHNNFKPLQLLSERKYEIQLDKSGVFSARNRNSSSQSKTYNHIYCVEHAFKEMNGTMTMNAYRIFVKPKQPPIPKKILITRYIKIVSCIFLLLTIAVYLLLPKMRNLFGKMLLNYCVSTFIFFASLTLTQFYQLRDIGCKFIGFLSFLSSFWSFTWLHLMCIDIWFSFGTPRTLYGTLQKDETKRLLQYSAIGWGFPILWVTFIALLSITNIMPELMHPYIGEGKCFLEDSERRPGNYSYILYLTIPLLIQQIFNVLLFVKTILYCLRIKAEIERMNDCEKRTKMNSCQERLSLIMKLAIIMGVLFIFETVSSFVDFRKNVCTEYIEVVWDSINCFQGVYIFIIFICKKKVYCNICEKITILKSEMSSVTSNTTTQVSMHNISESKNT
ncbi:probable G-protein coupled receptor Mth-like 6 isoform X2 [Harmonia axyridis]|uniref:probable G-protein coupled receptor Mth-like 6 isoform X2 n=1 Tax=Harmonia axyridis TaxID=115357 RepID=UPI001E2770AD|nr:probable G-protein coupled receptor Mth-like 6 isoform X2 [Harmonia axyridis]